ncbi:hypothetical protein RRG08_036909 [Elysia crispata]|uniref:Reverse transcriptase domain-containing protein n=1 Tax=Elysia crispata TaxID=231223 RepID=A0AAE1DHC9_9GAST|nr:hypothetical protein RRG08_036909 [Elysia crispata]
MKVDVVGTGDNDGDVGIGDNQGDFVGTGENDGDAVGSGENDDVPNRNSDENIEEHVKKKVLKGKENSKINLKKQKRAAGREYLRRVYADGKYSVVEKGKGGSCGCTHKYMCKNFWDDDREAVFQKIWSISWQEKAVLVGSMTDRVIRKRRKTKDDDNDNVTKTCTFHYHLKRNASYKELFQRSIASTMALYGHINEFNQTEENINDYLDRLDFYLEANNVSAPEKKRAILLSVVGLQQFRLLKDLAAPSKPAEKSFQELCKLLKDHHAPSPPKFLSREKFDARTRQPGESIANFVAALRHLSEHSPSSSPQRGSSRRQNQSHHQRQHFIDTPVQAPSSDALPEFNLFSISSSNPTPINDKNIEFQLDTGAALTVMTEKDFHEATDGTVPLQLCQKQLQTYTGESVPVAGECDISVGYRVLKKDGTVRICGDYYKITVNKEIEQNRYPIPNIEDISLKLAGGEKFTELDFSHAYTQLGLHPDSKKYTTINTHKGLYQYERLCFGISSSPGIFQAVMDSIFSDVPNVCVYFDNLYITGKDDTEHLQTLQRVLKVIGDKGLKVNKDKCQFRLEEINFLGYKLNKQGIRPQDKKTKAIKDAPSPENPQQLKAFLGMINYYSKFIGNLSSILSPLYKLLQKDVPWQWDRDQEYAFSAAKRALSSDTLLVHFDPAIPEHCSPRVQRWAITLAAYDYELKHKAGVENSADGLSRLPLHTEISSYIPEDIEMIFNVMETSFVNVNDVKRETLTDECLMKVYEFCLNGWPDECVQEELRPFKNKKLELSLEDGCILWGTRVVIPKTLQNKVLSMLHDKHIGASKMKSLARSWY